MTYTATITSKRQLTIPAELFKKTNLAEGDKVILEEKEGKIILQTQKSLIDELFGSVKVPKRLMGVDVDKAIKESKERYFADKKA